MTTQHYWHLIIFGLMVLLFSGCAPEYSKLNQSGFRKIEEKNYELALKDFNASIALNDNYWRAYQNRGAAYAFLGNFKMALDDFDRSITMHPNNPNAYEVRAVCRIELNDYKGAIEDFKEAIKRNYRLDNSYTRLGMLYAKMDSCEQAVHYLKIAVERKAYDACNEELNVVQAFQHCEAKAGNK
ncbi:MAG: tetratricopeptide repeat protein [Bacteroidetes bacterium]|nr:tetratricopeptide repeat protein [Bacteroidota bacterium]MBK8872425.1 tetratricopeptide repeat protein [Bacteroidota bacterium]